MAEKMASLGAVVARFQSIDLHEGYRELLDFARSRHEKIVIFVGSSPAALSRRDPLDFFSRRSMIEEFYGANSFIINELEDCSEDSVWSKKLDSELEKLLAEGQKAVIYGDENELKNRYAGRHEAHFFRAKNWPPEPEKIAALGSRDFRTGLFYAAFHRKYPLVFATVDVAILRDFDRQVLLGRKPDELQFRFPGGFSDPVLDRTFEAAALREAREECGPVELENLKYLGSHEVVEWRYSKSEDAVITHFFRADFAGGDLRASDDLEEIRWFGLSDFDEKTMVAEHRPLLKMLREGLSEMPF